MCVYTDGDGLCQPVCIVGIALLMVCVCVPSFGQCVCVCVSCVLSSNIRDGDHLDVSVQRGDEVGGQAGQSCVSPCVFVLCTLIHTPTVFSMWVLCESLCVLWEHPSAWLPSVCAHHCVLEVNPTAHALCESQGG